MRYLQQEGLVEGPALDFGSGWGYDAARYSMWMYDINPKYYSDNLEGCKFQTITCTYVLNTVFKKEEKKILSKIKSLLREGGTAYISVRRDIRGSRFGRAGSYQRRVHLKLPVVTDNSAFAIYKLEK